MKGLSSARHRSSIPHNLPRVSALHCVAFYTGVSLFLDSQPHKTLTCTAFVGSACFLAAHPPGIDEGIIILHCFFFLRRHSKAFKLLVCGFEPLLCSQNAVYGIYLVHCNQEDIVGVVIHHQQPAKESYFAAESQHQLQVITLHSNSACETQNDATAPCLSPAGSLACHPATHLSARNIAASG